MIGPLLLSINLIDLFLECKDDNINSYADDTASYPCSMLRSNTERLDLFDNILYCNNG